MRIGRTLRKSSIKRPQNSFWDTGGNTSQIQYVLSLAVTSVFSQVSVKKSRDQYSEPMPNREIVVSSKDPNFDDLVLDKKTIILNKNKRRGSLHIKRTWSYWSLCKKKVEFCVISILRMAKFLHFPYNFPQFSSVFRSVPRGIPHISAYFRSGIPQFRSDRKCISKKRRSAVILTEHNFW